MQQQAPERELRSKDAAAFLGWSVSKLNKKLDEIPHTKRGRLNYFKVSKLVEYRDAVCPA